MISTCACYPEFMVSQSIIALLQVLQGKYSMRGGVSCQMRYFQLYLIFYSTQEPTPTTVLCASQVDGTLTDLLLCIKMIISSSNN